MKPENYIQWSWFLEQNSSPAERKQLQHARKIDTKMANALSSLPGNRRDFDAPVNKLAFRNLLRGWTLELPAGSDVARKLGYAPINIAQDHDSLWYYILKEAETTEGKTLGKVGSTIVCATIAGLLMGDPYSFCNMNPHWSPEKDPLLIETDLPGN